MHVSSRGGPPTIGGLPCKGAASGASSEEGNRKEPNRSPTDLTRRGSDVAIPAKESSSPVNSLDAKGGECDKGQGQRDRTSLTTDGATDGMTIDEDSTNKSNALLKMEALKGIVRAQVKYCFQHLPMASQAKASWVEVLVYSNPFLLRRFDSADRTHSGSIRKKSSHSSTKSSASLEME